MSLLDDSLRAKSDEEVSAVGFVLRHSVAYSSGQFGGWGTLLVTILDWKSKTNLGPWVIKEWTTTAEPKDFQATYPDLAKKLKELHG